MKYYSTNRKVHGVTFEQALLQGQAPDKGLYMPRKFPQIDISLLKEKSYAEIAFLITRGFIDGISDEELKKITEDAYNYEVPLEKVYKNCYIMRLDRGPTASFKDFAARMMARLMQYYLKKQDKKLLILTATSGDTGGAVADAFYGMENIKIVVLFPKKEITERQRKQMTTLGKNIIAVSVKGKFDDCQTLVKEAFTDPSLSLLNLSSANSINVGRLIPQTVYYFYAYSRLVEKGKIIFSVPSGNFGNLVGGLVAKKMGLPVKKFVVAVNENDEFPKFLQTNMYKPTKPSRVCLSSAMNVGHPSNLARLVDVYEGKMDEKGRTEKMPDMEKIEKDMFAISISDEKTKKTIKEVFNNYKIVLEPHGAVAWNGLQIFLKKNPCEEVAVSLETAHPAKFPETVTELTRTNPEMPENMKKQQEKEEKMFSLTVDYSDFKKFLLENFSE